MIQAELLKSLASPRRQEILRLVWTDELSAGAIRDEMPDITFGAVSLQLRALTEAGLVSVRRDGRYRYYKARRQAVGLLAPMLEKMWDNALWRLTLAAELEQSRRGPRAVAQSVSQRQIRNPSRTRRSTKRSS